MTENEDIIALFWARDEAALPAAMERCGALCRTVARNLLPSPEDAEECVNDALLAAWRSIPPQRPRTLSAYLARLTRNAALDRLRRTGAAKRGGGELPLILDELSDFVPGGEDAETELERRELLRDIGAFLQAQPRKKRQLFVCRYWYAVPLPELARRCGMRENAVSVALHRLRRELRDYLEERGYTL